MFEFADPYASSSSSQVNRKALTEEREVFFKKIEKNGLRERLDFMLSSFNPEDLSLRVFGEPEVQLGKEEDLDDSQRLDLLCALRFFKPWKKGPFNLFGEKIEAEWRSDLKWERLLPQLEDQSGKVIADIGCHNGYFMFRLLSEDPAFVIGFDPVPKLYYNFLFLQNLARSPKIFYEPLGVESITHFNSFFDTIFCLGILYHRTDPVETLRGLHRSLKKGGMMIIDCQGIEGKGSYCLFPKKKYAGARGVWFVPTLECLINWLVRAQFKRVTCFYEESLSTKEQKATNWAPVASLEEYLDKKNPSLTIEGYPAPKRFYLKAFK